MDNHGRRTPKMRLGRDLKLSVILKPMETRTESVHVTAENFYNRLLSIRGCIITIEVTHVRKLDQKQTCHSHCVILESF